MSASMTWRDALRAMSIDAKRRAENSKPMPSGPNDPVTIAEKAGARYAFNVMSEELKYLAEHYSSQEALAKLRKLLSGDQGLAGDYREIMTSDVGRALFSAFGREWPTADFIGLITMHDVGKRVFLRGGILQVENDEQRMRRLEKSGSLR